MKGRTVKELVKEIKAADYSGLVITEPELESLGFDINWFFDYDGLEMPEEIKIEIHDESILDDEGNIEIKALRVSLFFDGKEMYMGSDEGYICEDNIGNCEDLWGEWFMEA